MRHVKESHARGNVLLEQAHREGVGGLKLAAVRTSFVDALLVQIWSHALQSSSAEGESVEALSSCALLAIGGYGRGELSPASDIDLLFLFSRRTENASKFVRTALYLLWDAGMTIGHSARTIAECLRIAREDYQSETAMMEHRFIAGERKVEEEFTRRLESYNKRLGKNIHLRRRLREKSERYQSWDPSVYVQEPNVKESAGGLRDVHSVLWLARVFGAGGLDGIEKMGLMAASECERVREAYDFLLRLRAQLHFQANSKNDLLGFAAQEEAAPALGYSGDENATASEKMMRDYFLRARTVHTFSRDFFDALDEHLKIKRWVKRKPRHETLGGGLALREYHTLVLEGDGQEVLSSPGNLMRIFDIQYRYGCQISPELRAFVRNHLDVVDDDFRTSAEVSEFFFRILDGKAGVAKTLHEMHDLGFLGRYIPEFDDLTCFVQYDQYHRYTADEHTLLTLASLDDLTLTKDLSLQELAHIHREMERTRVLRLALLFHDIGKAHGPRHVHKSAALLPAMIVRFGLPADEGRVMEFLVVNHMEMVHTAERRDIEDPVLIQRFSETVGTVEQLQMLYLLSYADVKSVAPGIWNTWRGALLHELYRKTLRALESGEETQRAKRIEDVLTQVQYEARATMSKIGEAEIRRHIEEMPERYRMVTPPQNILRHLEAARRLEKEGRILALDITHRRRLGNTLLTIVCRDQLGLFGLIAGALAAFDLSILDAKVNTREDGLVVDIFQVVDNEGKAVTDDSLWGQLEEVLGALLSKKTELDALLRKNRRYLRPKQRSYFDVPTHVDYDLTASDDATVLEVIAPDRHGLLVQISKHLAEDGISISRAKISTEGVRAVDTFYMTDADGRKIEDKEKLRSLCERLAAVLSGDAASKAAVT
ncbi:MAG: [protein-PII] uridylyltransferase [bacterium]|nr:[protein-PII] uridylyltransferase [bacterium]